MHCLASLTLRNDGRTTEEAEGGTTNHSYMESLALRYTKGETLDPAEDPVRVPLFLRCVGDGVVVGVERTYALHVKTGAVRHLGDRLNRQYDAAGRKDDEVVCTVDLVVRLSGGMLRIIDWKSRERVTDVLENWQMRIGTMGATGCEDMGAAEDAEMILGYLDDGEMDTCTVDYMTVSAWWSDLFALRDRLARHSDTHQIHEGSWCKYCPAMVSCPAKTQLALAMIGELNVAGQISELSDEQCGRVWEKARSAKDIVERVIDAVKERARTSPVPLPNGKRLVLVEQRGRETLDRDEVERVFTELGRPLPIKRGPGFTVTKEMKR